MKLRERSGRTHRSPPQPSRARTGERSHSALAMPALGATLAPAAGDIVMAACQRSIALHAHWINESVSRTFEHTRPTAQGDEQASPMQQGEWVRAAMFEPTWHYMVGLMSLGRTTGDSLVTLMSSQMRGAQDEVDALSRDAHENAVQAAQTAASAAVAAMTCCAQAVSHLSERATQAARKAAQGQGMSE